MRVARSTQLAILSAGLLAVPACSRHVFEPVPSTPEAVLAFRLRTLHPGRTIRIQRIDGWLSEGTVVTAGADQVVLAHASGADTVAATSVGIIWQRRGAVGPTVGRTALGAALGVAIVLAVALGASELDDSMSLDEGLLWFAAPRLIASAAYAGGIFGTVVHLSAPEWSRIYPIPAGTRP
jgi:hypothetical protein